MAANSMKKMIGQIVRLKKAMQRWRHSSSNSGRVPLDVGLERRRFRIPVWFLNFPVIISLLNQAQEELGYQPDGVLTLPSCDADLFQLVIDLLQKEEKTYRKMEIIEEFINFGVSCDDGVEPALLKKVRA